jgi:hypothetical protein
MREKDRRGISKNNNSFITIPNILNLFAIFQITEGMWG